MVIEKNDSARGDGAQLESKDQDELKGTSEQLTLDKLEDEVKPYTTEELEDLIEGDKRIDTSRLTSEGKALLKSFERGYGKKFKRLSDREKEIESSQNVRQPKDIFEAYDMTPDEVMGEIDRQISANLDNNPHEAMKLMNLKTSLIQRSNNRNNQINQARIIGDKILDEIREDIEDIDEKIPAIRKFASDELDLSVRDLDFLSNPMTVGPEMAKKVTLALNKVYDLIKARGTFKKKEEKGKMKVEGVGDSTRKEEDKPESIASLEKEYADAMETAKKTSKNDDWLKVTSVKRRLFRAKEANKKE